MYTSFGQLVFVFRKRILPKKLDPSNIVKKTWNWKSKVPEVSGEIEKTSGAEEEEGGGCMCL